MLAQILLRRGAFVAYALVMYQIDSDGDDAAVAAASDDDESVTPTLPGFVRASKPPAPPGFVRPSSRPKKTSGAAVANAYRAEVCRPKPSVTVVGPARMATCAACGAAYDPLAREAHEASIAHQLAVGPRTRGRRVMLPEANPGAKILERMGWADDGERFGQCINQIVAARLDLHAIDATRARWRGGTFSRRSIRPARPRSHRTEELTS